MVLYAKLTWTIVSVNQLVCPFLGLQVTLSKFFNPCYTTAQLKPTLFSKVTQRVPSRTWLNTFLTDCKLVHCWSVCVWLFVLLFAGEHSHPAAAGCSLPGQPRLPLHRQRSAAGFMVNTIPTLVQTVSSEYLHQHKGLFVLLSQWLALCYRFTTHLNNLRP